MKTKNPVVSFLSTVWALTLTATIFIGIPAVIISVVWMIVKAAFL